MGQLSRIEEMAEFEKFDAEVLETSFWPTTGIRLDFSLKDGVFSNFCLDAIDDLDSDSYVAIVKGLLYLLEGKAWKRIEEISFRELENFLRDDNREAALEGELYRDFFEELLWRVKVLSWTKLDGIDCFSYQKMDSFEEKLEVYSSFFHEFLNPKVAIFNERIELVSLEDNQVCIAFKVGRGSELWKSLGVKEVFNRIFSEGGPYLVVEEGQIS